MGKTRHGQRELSREKRLNAEIKLLKRELSHLRKQISRLDEKRLQKIKKICDDNEEAENSEDNEIPVTTMEDLKKEWKCNFCAEGYLQILLYSKLGITHYYRKCSDCDHRTKGKRYDSEEVKGIIKE